MRDRRLIEHERKMRRTNRLGATPSTGNVFRDVGFSGAESELRAGHAFQCRAARPTHRHDCEQMLDAQLEAESTSEPDSRCGARRHSHVNNDSDGQAAERPQDAL